MNQFLEIFAMGGVDRETYAGQASHDAARDFQRLAQGCLNVFSQVLGLLARDFLRQHGEFVACQPHQRIAFTQRGLDAGRSALQDLRRIRSIKKTSVWSLGLADIQEQQGKG